MAKARTIRIETDENDDPAALQAAQDAEDLAEATEIEGEDLFRITDEIRNTAGVKLMIVRTWPNTPEMAGHVGDLTPGEFSIERMRELYGPGRYRVRLIGPKGFLKGGGAVHIARTNAESPASAASGGMADITAFLKAMREQDEARQREAATRRDRLIELALPGAISLLAAVLGRNTQPDMTTLIAALKPPPGPSLTDLTQSLTNLKTLTDSGKPDGATSQIEMLFKILEASRDLMGGGGDDKKASNWIDLARDLVKEAIPMARPLLENLQAQQTARPLVLQPIAATPLPNATISNTSPSSSANATPIPAASVGSTVSGENDVMAFFLPLIRTQLAKLVTWAQEQRRVELYAEVLLEELPAAVHKYISPQDALKYLEHPQWFEVICAQDGRLSPHREWCDAMRLELIDIITEQLRQDKTEEPPAQIVDPLNGDSEE